MASKKRRNTSIKNWFGENSAGFTLIEVLIATLVLSMVVYLATLSYSLFLDTWERKKLSDIAAIQEYRTHLLMRNAVESTFDYYVTDPKSKRNTQWYPFFKGQKESLEFVTLSSVFQKGKPAIARIRLKKSTSGNPKVLVYEETSLVKTYIRYNDDPVEYKNEMSIYDNLKSVHIRYFGIWALRFDPGKEGFVEEYKWQETFQGKERNAVPHTIEMTVAFEEGETMLVFPVMAHSQKKGTFFNHER